MKTVNKKPEGFIRRNVLADQVKEQRHAMITKVKALREQRYALKGVKGTGKQWAELSTQIDELSGKIDLLSKSLGIPVKVTNSSMSGRPHQLNNEPGTGHEPVFTGNKLAQSIADKPQYHQKHSPDGRVDLVGQRRGHVDVVAAETPATASKLV